ncbi:MAG: PaaI family thioesterase [Armatimonadota bacterium]|nr:PaaI family thioesterase [Armatimonadota bacterium]MDR5697830.1 PaaI family thioesterase [Armatimonadota bacterium]
MSEARDRPAIQDRYPDEFSHCYGCGRLNEHGLGLKSYAEGEEVVATFVPGAHHVAVPGFVYGGLIASLIDCHAMATAAHAYERAAGGRAPRFVTASLRVDYLRPTPLGVPLRIRGRAKDVAQRKVTVEVTVSADSTPTARGEVVAVLLPDTMRSPVG